MLKKNDQIKIIYSCINMMHFCHDASKTMIPNPDESESMQNICKGFSKIFSTLEKDFEAIANLAGLSLDLTTQKGKIILEKIKTLPNLNKSQQRKCMKEICTLLRIS